MEEQMTDFQFRKLMEMVLMILQDSKDLDEAIKKVKALTEKDGN